MPCDGDGSVSGKIPAPRKQRPVQFAFIRVTKSDSLVDSLYHLFNMFNGTQDELRDYIQEKGIKRREGGVSKFLGMKI